MAEQAGLYHNISTLVTDTEVKLAFDSAQIVRINLDFPWTTVNLAAFALNCLTVLTVNAVVLVWLKMKENTLVSASKSSIRRFVITEKAPTRAFSWLKAATTAFTFKTLLRHYAKRVLTPRSLNMKL